MDQGLVDAFELVSEDLVVVKNGFFYFFVIFFFDCEDFGRLDEDFITFFVPMQTFVG